MVIASEIELKLTARPDDLPKLKRALVAMSRGAPAEPAALVSTYYDTPDRALARRGMVLRIREKEGRFTQTVKIEAAPGEGWLVRGEWEDAVCGNRPHLDAPHSGRHVPKELAGALRPVFATEVTRSTIILAPDRAVRIEAAIDEGEIRAGRRIEPISEIELELRQGPITLLYDIAERLLDAAPLHIEARSKAERGYRLSGAARDPEAVHAEPVALDPDLSGRAALLRIARSCLGQFLRNRPAALTQNPEGVHQMRVALRRLRAALSAFKGELPASERRRTVAALRRLTRSLAGARNLDVLADELLPPVRAALPQETDLDHLATAVDWARRNAYARLQEEILSPRFTALILHLLHGFETWGTAPSGDPAETPAGPPIAGLAPRLIDRHRRAVRRRGKGFRRQNARQRHRLRIAVKKLRYTIEMFGSLFAAVHSAKFVKRLRRLQDELGYANDVRVAHELIAELCAQAEPGGRLARAGSLVLDWHARRLARRRRKLRRRLRRLRSARSFWRDADAAGDQAR